jgi:pimeloyl-ACP methyl ester carboxylesterase
MPPHEMLPEVPAAPEPTRSGDAPVNDIRMHYATYGGGRPILLLHGGLGHSEYWSLQIPELARMHEVIVVDSRGHGRSTRSSAPYSYALMASDVVAFLDYMQVRRVSIVGWSDGGIIGLHVAMHHPERVEGLFAFGANFNLAGLKPDGDKDPVFAAYTQRAGKDYARLSPTPAAFDEFVKAVSEMWSSQPDYDAQDLRRIAAPTVIAAGAYDEVIEREHTEELARLVPGARLEILPAVGHFAPWQNPAQFNEAVLEFIDAN